MRRVRRPLVALVALVAALAIGYAVKALSSDDSGTSPAPTSTPSVSAVPGGAVALSALPPEVGHTVRLIQNGGPLPYPRNDGVVFHNNERRLPREPDGYYHEYTVPTPSSPDRGRQRVITGAHGEYWYTSDHYETFRRVDVHR